jgi:hypothetical protein
MCVVLICPQNVRPSHELLRACEQCNPHGAGIAYPLDSRRLAYHKGLDLEDLLGLLEIVPDDRDLVIHFRFTSAGMTHPSLCHPFPITKHQGTRLHGTARSLLFHNGTWSGYRDVLEQDPSLLDSLPLGKGVSDTCVLAALLARKGSEILRRIPGRFAVMTPKSIQLHGDWEEHEGMRVSNRHFLSSMRTCVDEPIFPDDSLFTTKI